MAVRCFESEVYKEVPGEIQEINRKRTGTTGISIPGCSCTTVFIRCFGQTCGLPSRNELPPGIVQVIRSFAV